MLALVSQRCNLGDATNSISIVRELPFTAALDRADKHLKGYAHRGACTRRSHVTTLKYLRNWKNLNITKYHSLAAQRPPHLGYGRTAVGIRALKTSTTINSHKPTTNLLLVRSYCTPRKSHYSSMAYFFLLVQTHGVHNALHAHVRHPMFLFGARRDRVRGVSRHILSNVVYITSRCVRVA